MEIISSTKEAMFWMTTFSYLKYANLMTTLIKWKWYHKSQPYLDTK